ncbi:MAG: dephospho-coenzyme kinase [Bacteroidetes bacterium]|nr:dephospho-coenzyme kinase [Bacteroidota bacterium]
MGRFVIQADDAARKLADEDPQVKAEIEAEFGLGAYLPNGAFDRKKMAAIVFADKQKRSRLDSIIHPRVFSVIGQQLASLPIQQATPYVLIEAALIYEAGMDASLDYVVVVAADEETCIQRVVRRDGISREDVKRRVSAQMPMDKKIKRADFVIHNDGTEADLKAAVLFLDSILSHLTVARTS